jgi:hypothetical protein
MLENQHHHFASIWQTRLITKIALNKELQVTCHASPKKSNGSLQVQQMAR